jgi:hypothetical protein
MVASPASLKLGFAHEIATLPQQVDDLENPCLPPLEAIQREAEALQFHIDQFRLEVGEMDDDTFIDHIEKAMSDYGTLHHLTVENKKIKGMWMRSCWIPQGVMSTTKIHMTEHPLAIMQGALTVWTPETGCITYGAPNILITKPGTRRLVYAHTDVMAVTFHPGEDEDVAALEARIIKPRTNNLIENTKP